MRTTTAALALFAALALGCGAGLPPTATSTLDDADTFEVMRLDPSDDAASAGAEGAKFGGFKVAARAEVRDPAARRRIREIVDSGLRKGGTLAKCFNPRHAIHAVAKGHVTDLVICFECSAVAITDDGHQETRPIGDVAAELDAELARAGAK